jgi:hypothetical protein
MQLKLELILIMLVVVLALPKQEHLVLPMVVVALVR